MNETEKAESNQGRVTMENEKAEEVCTINTLPNEIISLILLNSECHDILSFGVTCKRFNDLVNNDQSLWKNRFKHTLSSDVADVDDLAEVIDRESDADWMSEVRRYYEVRSRLHNELIHMSPQFYWRTTDVSLEDMRNIYIIALSHNLSYYYTIITLQTIIKNGKRSLDYRKSKKPLTLTEMHYAKVALRHLIHTYLCIKWVKKHIKRELTPEVVVNFFVQWTDTDSLYSDQQVTNKVIDYKCGNPIAIGATYNAIAKKFGIDCDLISFPNHLFLEWREHSGGCINLYTIDLKTGEIQPKRQCPFSQGGPVTLFKYYPDSLLQYIYSIFHMTMGAIKNWHTHNALHLLDFLGTDDNAFNPYRNFLPYLLDIAHLPAINAELNLKFLNPQQMKIIHSLSRLNAPANTACRPLVVKKRHSSVKFAVGMICYHKKYEYVCIIRGWDVRCAVEWQRRMESETLDFGLKQPFYHVIAADQSDRYVAQENLAEVAKPSRLYHLEDFIAREFTYFDGFAYVPNDEKKLEYPEEGRVVERYRTISKMRMYHTRKERRQSAEPCPSRHDVNCQASGSSSH